MGNKKGSKWVSEPFPVPGRWRGGTQSLRPREQSLPALALPHLLRLAPVHSQAGIVRSRERGWW